VQRDGVTDRRFEMCAAIPAGRSREQWSKADPGCSPGGFSHRGLHVIDTPAVPIAIVTGATGAIGAATARRLVAAGWRVALIGRDLERVDALVAELGSGSVGIVADATRSAEVDAAFGEAMDRLGPPDALVHAVGSTLLKPVHTLSDSEIDDVLAANLLSALYALRAFVRVVPRGRAASVVLFSSAATKVGLLNHEAIAAAKGGIEGLMLAAAATYASRGIRVNAISPGLVRSNLTRRLVENAATLRASEAMHPLGRVGEAEDVAGLAAFLVSRDASWITGQSIAVDGGLSGIKLPPRITL
jgi:NAD(P)-dependent dehydrogenase (short-subunit alcohol dehydrogenase family)